MYMLSRILKLSSLDEILSKTTKLLISFLTEDNVFVCSIIKDLDVLTGRLVRGSIEDVGNNDILRIWLWN